MDAAQGTWRSATGRQVAFHPDPVRYGNTYLQWLAEKRDWCISRQLWWGHRIPIWSGTYTGEALQRVVASLAPISDAMTSASRLTWPDGTSQLLHPGSLPDGAGDTRRTAEVEVLVCLRDAQAESELAPALTASGLVQDPDVLDTWFSSGLWPMSTLGWPDPETAMVDPGQAPLGQPAWACRLSRPTTILARVW